MEYLKTAGEEEEEEEEPTMMTFLLLDLPSELFLHVLGLLPLKYLMRLRCVSKFFLDLTNNPNFITTYRKSNLNSDDFNFIETTSSKSNEWHRFLILFKGSNFIYLRKRHELIPFHCPNHMRFIGSMNGLICFGGKLSLEIYNIFAGTNYYLIPPVFNPFPPWYIPSPPKYVFGYDPISSEYKIIRIQSFSYLWIYSFGTNSWKQISLHYDYGTVYINSEGGRYVCINGVIYWPPCEPGYHYSEKIVFFNLHKEKFGLIKIPKQEDQLLLLLSTTRYEDIKLLYFRGCLTFAFINTTTITTTTSHGGGDGGGGEIWVDLYTRKNKLWNKTLSFVVPIQPPPKEVEIVSCADEIFLGWFESDQLRLYNLHTKCIFNLPLSPHSHYYPKASFMEKKKENDDNPTYVDNLSFDFSLIRN